jgi:hypothetical protein
MPAALWHHVGWWVDVLFEDAASCWNYLAIVTDKWTITEHWGTETVRRNKEYSEKKTVSVSHCLPQIPHRQARPRNSMWPYVSVLSPDRFYFLFAVPHKIYLLMWMTVDKIKCCLPLLLSIINIRCSYIHTSLYGVTTAISINTYISHTAVHYQYVHQVIKNTFKLS